MKNKIKTWWKKVQTFFRNPIKRLFTGTILIILAVLIRTGIIQAYLGIYASITIGIIWILFALFYFAMCVWARLTH